MRDFTTTSHIFPLTLRELVRTCDLSHLELSGGAETRGAAPAKGAALKAGGLVSRVLSTSPSRRGVWPSISDARRHAPLAVNPEMLASRAGSLSLSDLAPGGVYLAALVTRGTGALLPHRFTLTFAFTKRRTRPRSAFCCTCRRLTRPAVSWHPALRCSDFPRCACARAGVTPNGVAVPTPCAPRGQTAHTAARKDSRSAPAMKKRGGPRASALRYRSGLRPGTTAGGSR